MYKLVTDSTADLPAEYLREHNVGCLSLSYIIEGQRYGADRELPWKDFYDIMRQGIMPTTSQVNPQEAKAFFEELVEQGNKEILYLAFSSGLSGSYNNAKLATDEVMEERPDVHIIVIDTLCASLGEGLLVHKAVQLRDAGKSMEETAEWVQSHLLNFGHVFTVDDLFHLYRGGRVSKTTAFVGTIAGIKPKLHVDDEGHLIVIDKIRGRKKSLLSLVDYMGEKMGNMREENDIVFIGHGDALEDAEFVKTQVEERFGIHNFLISNIGPVIGAHTGPGIIALFFVGESR